MYTAVTKRGQTVVPAPIRKRYGIADGARLVWLDDGQTIKVVPVDENDDPVKALRGRGRGGKATERLLDERKKDRERERGR